MRRITKASGIGPEVCPALESFRRGNAAGKWSGLLLTGPTDNALGETLPTCKWADDLGNTPISRTGTKTCRSVQANSRVKRWMWTMNYKCINCSRLTALHGSHTGAPPDCHRSNTGATGTTQQRERRAGAAQVHQPQQVTRRALPGQSDHPDGRGQSPAKRQKRRRGKVTEVPAHDGFNVFRRVAAAGQ